MRTFTKDPFKHWEDWFAWYPIHIYDEERKGWVRIWRETVQRRMRMFGYDPEWEYQLKDNPDART